MGSGKKKRKKVKKQQQAKSIFSLFFFAFLQTRLGEKVSRIIQHWHQQGGHNDIRTKLKWIPLLNTVKCDFQSIPTISILIIIMYLIPLLPSTIPM